MAFLSLEHGASERRACRLVGQHRSTQRYRAAPKTDEDRLVVALHELARKEPSWGSPMVTNRLRLDGWAVNHKRVERLWRLEGLQVRRKRRKRRRVGCSENGIIRLRPERLNHVWTYDFVMDRTEDGRRIKILGVVDEYSRECLALEAGRHFRGEEVCTTLEKLVEKHGRPQHIRSDNGPEFVADSVKAWLSSRKVGTLFIASGSPWENAYIESFFGKLRGDLIDLEAFATLKEAQVLLEIHRRKYNSYRPHSSLGGIPPADFRKAASSSPNPTRLS